MSEETKMMSALDIFAQSQETFEDAKKKSNDESGNRANYFRISKDGDYTIRILPLAPVIDADGNVLPMERKGYEYPVKELVLKIKGDKDKDGKDKLSYVNVCNAKYVFPQLKSDLIDTYVEKALSMYSNDEKLCKKVKETSFQGGLRYDSKRCMYILDMEHRNDGLQVFQLSFAQYKEVEERKLKLWTKLNKKGNVPCPISSIKDAYPLSIIRSTEKKKTSYSFNISVEDGKDELNEDELNMLLDAPRLPEVLYTYKRFHLEATIAYLNQYDEETGMEVMKTQEIKDCIDQIKLLLPADDQTHFNANNNSGSEGSSNGKMTIEDLWNLYDKLCDDKLTDKSEEGQELRTTIKEFIDDNQLDVQVTRKKSNEDLLNEIDEALGQDGDSPDAEEEEPEEETAPENEEVEEEEESPADEPSDDEEEEPDEETEEEPATPSTSRSRRERNDDTNEPAAEAPARQGRRTARPHRPRR